MFKLELKISGRVQGVNFRSFVRSHAQALGLVGFVKNNSDQSVSVLVQGESAVLNNLKHLCSTGPRWAQICAIEEKWTPLNTFTYTDFKIIR